MRGRWGGGVIRQIERNGRGLCGVIMVFFVTPHVHKSRLVANPPISSAMDGPSCRVSACEAGSVGGGGGV